MRSKLYAVLLSVLFCASALGAQPARMAITGATGKPLLNDVVFSDDSDPTKQLSLDLSAIPSGTRIQAAVDAFGSFGGTYNSAAVAITGGTATNLSSLSTNGTGAVRFVSDSIIGLQAGTGLPVSNPPTAPTVATYGAGVLTGQYSWCYLESYGASDAGIASFTLCSPIVTATMSGNTALVTLPPPRKGSAERYLYRKNPGSSEYRYVRRGTGYYYPNAWVDNVPDATVAAAALAPTVNTTRMWNFENTTSVKVFRNSPDSDVGLPSDLTLLTGDSGYRNVWSLDVYGPVTGRASFGNNLNLFKHSTDANIIYASYFGNIDDGIDVGTPVFQVKPYGGTNITTYAMTDPGLQDGQQYALFVKGTFPAVTTGAPIGADFLFTGAGSSSNSQTGLRTVLAAGYTGTSDTHAIQAINATAPPSGGIAFGIRGEVSSNASSGLGVGVSGRVSGVPANKIGVYGSADGTAAAASMLVSGTTAAGMVATNGAIFGATPLLVLDNTTPVFYVTDNGGFVASGLSSNTSTDYLFNTNGKGGFKINAGTNIQIGTTNSSAISFMTNFNNVMHLPTTGGVVIGASTLTTTTGALGLNKMTASGSAPGAAGGKIELVCGTNAGTAKLTALAGTSTTPVTILDNIGAGVTGC